MSATLTYPGVYIQELPSGQHTITGVSTSVAVFVGTAPQGPVTSATLVQSWPEYQAQFGGLVSGTWLGYAVNQFFGNGGQQCYILRLVYGGNFPLTGGAAAVTAAAATGTVGGSLTLYASSPGLWGNNMQVGITPQTGGTGKFMLQVINATTGGVLESFANLSISPSDPNYVVAVIDNDSQYLSFADPTVVSSTPPAAPAAAPTATTVAAPSGLAVTTTATGGTLAAATYFYQVSALYNAVESQPATETSVTTTGSASSNDVSWTAAAPFNGAAATGYKIYRGTAAGAENVYYTVGAVTTFTDTGAAPAIGGPRPSTNVGTQLAGGADGTPLVPNDGNFENALLNDPAGNGLPLLDRVPIFNLLCIPGEADAPTVSSVQQYCATKRAFYIVDSPQNISIASLISSGPAGATTGSITGQYATNAAFYFPWVSAPDPLAGNRPALFPPCGFVAGIYAETDASRGVWKAPAGINASLTGESGLQYNITDLENGSLNPQAVNCLRSFKVYGDVVWGARTLAGNDQTGSQWKYIPIRRLALYLESSLYDGTQWVVFEPNDETLWGQIRLNVGTFMQSLFLQGAFAGSTAQQAYFVKCDGENNPDSSTALGIVNILVGFAPLYPAEFVVIQIQQIIAQTPS